MVLQTTHLHASVSDTNELTGLSKNIWEGLETWDTDGEVEGDQWG